MFGLLCACRSIRSHGLFVETLPLSPTVTLRPHVSKPPLEKRANDLFGFSEEDGRVKAEQIYW